MSDAQNVLTNSRSLTKHILSHQPITEKWKLKIYFDVRDFIVLYLQLSLNSYDIITEQNFVAIFDDNTCAEHLVVIHNF